MYTILIYLLLFDGAFMEAIGKLISLFSNLCSRRLAISTKNNLATQPRSQIAAAPVEMQ